MSAAVEWPGKDEDRDEPWTADEVLRWLASDCLRSTAISFEIMPPRENDDYGGPEWHRYLSNVWRIQMSHDLYLTLSALKEADPVKADEAAHRTVLAAVCGDSYGEWAWQWAEDQGLDAQAITDEARAKVADR